MGGGEVGGCSVNKQLCLLSNHIEHSYMDWLIDKWTGLYTKSVDIRVSPVDL